METKNYRVENGVLVEVDKEWEGEFVVPDGVWKLGGGAFKDCEKVTKVVIPKSVLQIDSRCFIRCKADIEIDSERYVFDGKCLIDKDGCCVDVKCAKIIYCKKGSDEYVVPEWVSGFDERAFSEIGRLVMHDGMCGKFSWIVNQLYKCGGKAVFPRMTEKMMKSFKFSDVDAIEAVIELEDESGWSMMDETVVRYGVLEKVPRKTEKFVVPSEVKVIGGDAFLWSKKSLRKVVMNENVKDIENLAFEEFEALEEVVLPEGLDLIRNGVFYGCKSLKKLKIPKSVRTMDDNPFEGCSIDFEIEGDKWVYDGTLLIDNESKTVIHCRADVKEVRVPDWIEKVSISAFDGCEQLKKVWIGKNVDVAKNFERHYEDVEIIRE